MIGVSQHVFFCFILPLTLVLCDSGRDNQSIPKSISLSGKIPSKWRIHGGTKHKKPWKNHEKGAIYHLVMSKIAIEHEANIVSFPIKDGHFP